MSKKRACTGTDLSPVPVYERFSYAEKENALEYIYKYSNTIKRAGRGENHIYNNLLISADTETSKTGENVYRYTQKKKGGKVRKVQEYVPQENIVVAWTVSVRNLQGNICTVYGAKPSQFATFLKDLQERLDGEKTLIYWYNLPFDWVMVQLFIYQVLGYPVKQLNVKPHYPISIEFENGIIFRDALIIGQKSLGKWAEELQVEHQKETGKWNYDLIRKQDGNFTEDELLYIEHDTLALVECLDKLRISLNKHVYSLPYTCTGIIREECRNVGRVNRAKNRFLRIAPDFELYQKLERMFHGGYTHNNRNTAGWVYPTQEQKDKGYYPTCYDFCSSYPARMLYTKMPCERFRKLPDEHINRKEILKNAETTAYCFTFIAENAILKDMEEPMPVLQLSKCLYVKGEVCDNGRIIFAEKLCIEINELDLILIDRQYRFTSHDCVDVYASHKDYLPKWFRDLVFKCFKEKTMKKGGDAVDYSLAKARLNSL